MILEYDCGEVNGASPKRDISKNLDLNRACGVKDLGYWIRLKLKK